MSLLYTAHVRFLQNSELPVSTGDWNCSFPASRNCLELTNEVQCQADISSYKREGSIYHQESAMKLPTPPRNQPFPRALHRRNSIGFPPDQDICVNQVRVGHLESAAFSRLSKCNTPLPPAYGTVEETSGAPIAPDIESQQSHSPIFS